MDKRSEKSKNNLGQYTSPKWKSGKTTAIRIPLLFKDEILEIVKALDNGQNIQNKNQANDEVIHLLKRITTHKREGGLYDGRSAASLRKYVLKAIELLEKSEIENT